jgi:hypothetical protein
LTSYLVSTWILPVLVAITFHEAAHAYAAYALGDQTAFRVGRLSLNPLKHIDPVGTVLLPGSCFSRDRPSYSATQSRFRLTSAICVGLVEI